MPGTGGGGRRRTGTQPTAVERPVRGQAKGKVETLKGYYLAFMDGRSIRADIRPPGKAGGERGRLAPSGRQTERTETARYLVCVRSGAAGPSTALVDPGRTGTPGGARREADPLGGTPGAVHGKMDLTSPAATVRWWRRGRSAKRKRHQLRRYLFLQ